MLLFRLPDYPWRTMLLVADIEALAVATDKQARRETEEIAPLEECKSCDRLHPGLPRLRCQDSGFPPTPSQFDTLDGTGHHRSARHHHAVVKHNAAVVVAPLSKVRVPLQELAHHDRRGHGHDHGTAATVNHSPPTGCSPIVGGLPRTLEA